MNGLPTLLINSRDAEALQVGILCIASRYTDDSNVPWDLVHIILRYCENDVFRWVKERSHPDTELRDNGTIICVSKDSFSSYGGLGAAVLTANSGLWEFELKLDAATQSLLPATIMYFGFVTADDCWEPTLYPPVCGDPEYNGLWFHLSSEATREAKQRGKPDRLVESFTPSGLDGNKETFTLQVDMTNKIAVVIAHTSAERFFLCSGEEEAESWWVEPPFQPFVYLNYIEDSATLVPSHCRHLPGESLNLDVNAKTCKPVKKLQ
eukprot:TRINITY_DN60835_c0_g1_i1.p1 TRINITY_DN60835_c0_g1~~TRINITY_DN60835_c0_g1_i1.p1  ORF type:complete len:265 (-),score=15.50 TRINITY_DN60835_c0_g1_i1:181-975(-)